MGLSCCDLAPNSGMEAAMQNMAMQAAANAAGSTASGVAAGAAAGAAAAAAQAGLAAAVAGAAQSAGIAGAVGASAAAAVATTAAVAVASAAGMGLLGNNTTAHGYCHYPNLGYRDGNISLFLEGIPRAFTQHESRLIQDVLVEAYNEVSGVCDDIYQREMLNSTLSEQIFYSQLAGSNNVLVCVPHIRNWLWVVHIGCLFDINVDRFYLLRLAQNICRKPRSMHISNAILALMMSHFSHI